LKLYKLLTGLFIISLIFAGNLAFCKDASSDSRTKLISDKQLKGTISGYKPEFVNQNWWEKFNDANLNSYIIKAAQYNHDLKIATYKVYETQAKAAETLAKEFPQLGLGLNFSRQKTSDNISMGNLHIPSYTENTFLIPLNVNYELDIWHKSHDKTLSAKKEIEAAKFNEKAVYISLASATASAYFNVVKSDKLIELQTELVSIRKNIFDLTKEKNKYGLAPATDVISSDKSYTESLSSLASLQKYNSVFLNQLAVLTGESSDNSGCLKRSSIDEIDLSAEIPSDIKSDIVLERPDILKAEAELQKAKIDINVARKDFLPTIGIAGQFGFNANDLSKVFNWDSYIASVGSGVAETLFSGGQRRAKLKAKKMLFQEIFENYQKTILISFQEVNDSLAALKYDGQKDKNNRSRLKSEEKNLDLMTYKHNTGCLSYLELLQYKERVLVLKQEQLQSKTDILIDSLSLYKATGGKI